MGNSVKYLLNVDDSIMAMLWLTIFWLSSFAMLLKVATQFVQRTVTADGRWCERDGYTCYLTFTEINVSWRWLERDNSMHNRFLRILWVSIHTNVVVLCCVGLCLVVLYGLRLCNASKSNSNGTTNRVSRNQTNAYPFLASTSIEIYFSFIFVGKFKSLPLHSIASADIPIERDA